MTTGKTRKSHPWLHLETLRSFRSVRWLERRRRGKKFVQSFWNRFCFSLIHCDIPATRFSSFIPFCSIVSAELHLYLLSLSSSSSSSVLSLSSFFFFFFFFVVVDVLLCFRLTQMVDSGSERRIKERKWLAELPRSKPTSRPWDQCTNNHQSATISLLFSVPQAFQVVLRDQYSIDNFRTLKTPPPRMSDRRRKLETMFYSSGFSQKSMQPEIRRELRRTDPERARRKVKRHLLESSREEVVRLVLRNTRVSSNFMTSWSSTNNDNAPAVTEAVTEDAGVKDLDQKTSVVTFDPTASLEAVWGTVLGQFTFFSCHSRCSLGVRWELALRDIVTALVFLNPGVRVCVCECVCAYAFVLGLQKRLFIEWLTRWMNFLAAVKGQVFTQAHTQTGGLGIS